MIKSPQTHATIFYQRFSKDGSEEIEAKITVESSVTLTVNGEVWLSFMCTASDLNYLAAGFLYNEGFIQSRSEIEFVQICPTNDNVDVWLNHPLEKPPAWKRASGCGNGVSSGEIVENYLTPLAENFTLTPKQVLHALDLFLEEQRVNRQAGGAHASALYNGEIITQVVEDLGRHNTVDKLSGRCLLEGLPMAGQIVLTTGRISSDMTQKAIRMGCPMVISLNSTNAYSMQIAEKYGVTLIGHARSGRFSVYTHPERINSSIPAGKQNI